MSVMLNDDREPQPRPTKRLVFLHTRINYDGKCDKCGRGYFITTSKSLGVTDPDRFCCKTCEAAAGMVEEQA